MKNLDISGFNLNLLIVFEALIIEQNVSRAAQRIGLTQPSVSNALNRLRLLVGDDLFIRTPKGMRPTSRALDLAGSVQNALEQIRIALSKSGRFDPSSTERRFNIGASGNVDYALLPEFPAICRAAPRARFDIIDAISSEFAVPMLDSGSIDLAIGLFRSLPKRLDSVSLYSERYVCVARRNHPDLTHGLTLEKFTSLPHLSITRDTAGIVDAALGERGLTRRIGFVVPSFSLVPHVVEGTDLLAVVGERVGQNMSRTANLECHLLPVDYPPWDISAVWLRRSDPDEGISWLLTMLRQAGRLLAELNGVSLENK